MRQCKFCGRWFQNKQAVRAHLKACPLKVNFIRTRYRVEGYTFEVTIADKAHEAIKNTEIRTANGMFGALKVLKTLGYVKEYKVVKKPIR